MNILDGVGTVTNMPNFDVDATNAMANIKQAEAAFASINLMKEQLAASKKENKRMFILALVSATAAILSTLPELFSVISSLCCNV